MNKKTKHSNFNPIVINRLRNTYLKCEEVVGPARVILKYCESYKENEKVSNLIAISKRMLSVSEIVCADILNMLEENDISVSQRN